MGGHILVIDQGTTSTRAIVFDARAQPVASAQREFPQIYPHPGWIEHNPEDLWNTTLSTAREALAKIGGPGTIAGIGIANQRETTIVWDRRTGEPIHNAIVWQDRRTADRCAELARAGHGPLVGERAGLVLDPYFSATKIAWILDHVEGARERAARGELAFGAVDTFLLWRLTGGAVHATDATNASRTALLDIRTARWDESLIACFDVPLPVLPEVRDTAGLFGKTLAEHFGAPLPVWAMAGDQQSALVGQVCLSPGMAKATYGTGGFILLNTGATPIRSQHGLLTTIAYQWDGVRHYALEGSIFSAGATVQWLRDGLGIIADAAEAGALAAQSDLEQEVYMVPAFAGLGAPHWRADARCAIMGLTRGATRKELARAALESVGFQTDDLLAVMTEDYVASGATEAESVVRVDGGMVASDWTMQFLADIVGAPVDRPTNRETTALGAAFLAGELAAYWGLDRRFTPTMSPRVRARRRAGWRVAVEATLHRREQAP
jgi:glycerol kinase